MEEERRPLLSSSSSSKSKKKSSKARSWAVAAVCLVSVGAVIGVWGAPEGGGVELAVHPRERRSHHGASPTVRSRSLFTCALCAIAALVILIPRLACGPDDANGASLGPGEAEALVSKELRAGLTLLVPFLGIGVPLTAVDRALVRGEFPYPLSLTALELAATCALGLTCSKRSAAFKEDDEDDQRNYKILSPLGLCLLVATGSVKLALHDSCGPRVVAAFSSAQGLFVLCAACGLKEDVFGGGGGGIPGFAALVALIITFGGAAVMGLGEAEVGHVAAACVAILLAGQVCAAGFYLGIDNFFRRDYPASDSLFPVLAQTAAPAAFLAGLAAAVWEVMVPRLGASKLAPVVASSYWLLAADVGGFALFIALALAVIRRFSALVLVLFLATNSAVALFTNAFVFGDVVTSLEYKGAMILVLGLAIWGLEVSKATLETPPATTASPLPPSNFLEIPPSDDDDDEEAAAAATTTLDELAIVRLGRSGLLAPTVATTTTTADVPSQ